ncbi:hypothetical protein CO005_00740 [Candidatus Roizmanbacteria bacterium CG_4_8_14_3_um_filter_34_9]|uniref:PIN domain-containing protein n=3 Tax=Candidatus Roizmaniibacteriota TaxID=1752723 RepID=A0A2M7ATQ2_9BACT|nr:MAG: hypothetical protein COT02_05565 [Candidatus Roizmanbacteria bacterium CG07_land_8_20_14_0_80_34_15]PIU73978.1 MAG: hypothetical protein COS77_04000 [Candidatus Roizmanbacteria bacterium CG06_land_8_20_14_3_00_34_14]PIW73568.1 MAG: hypothetical protein CO005_00740 [Candidatus Roizmanbacteria bacterium CG_4_8_14_3_um_filter_34_9]
MGILIDSNIIIDFLNNQDSAVDFFKNKSQNKDLFISIISWAEVVYGFRKNKSHKKVQLFKDFLQENNIFIISIDQKVAEKYLDIKIDLEIKRIPLDEFDLLIAATALANNLSLSTRNVKHFKRINNLILL